MRVIRPLGIASVAIIVMVSAGTLSPSAHAASPVPGRFCASADIGTKVSTSKYGVVVCKKSGDRARWMKVKPRVA